MTRILFGGTEVPSLGGTSTAVYDLFERMLREGRDVHLVNLLEDQDAAWYRHTFPEGMGNPRGLANVANYWLENDPIDPQPVLQERIESIAPDVMCGFGYYASMLLKAAAPTRPTVLVTGSCAQAAEYVTTGRARDAVSLAGRLAATPVPPRVIQHGERTAVETCDLVVAHSRQTLDLMQWFFPASMGNIYPRVVSFVEWICDGARPWEHLARPFEDRDIGVLFIATDWDRRVKHYPMVRRLASELRDLPVHVVGDATRPAPGAVHHGFIESRQALFELLGRARCVACPSLIDAAPGVLFEASVMGCNVVASKNCGNWEMCHPDLLVDPYGARGFASCIRRAQERRFPDGIATLLAQGGYAELLAVLAAVAEPFRVAASQ